MILNNQDDQENFQKCISDNVYGWKQKLEGEGNIFEANKWFFQKIEKADQKKCLDIYHTLIDKFLFSLIIIDEETDPWAIFRVLNTTGVELGISDLVKSLFISRTDSLYNQEQVFKKWNREVVKRISSSSSKEVENKEVGRFLFSFLISYCDLSMTVAKRDKLYRLYEERIKGKRGQEKTLKETSSLFNNITDYAEVYEKIIKITDYDYWWEKYWTLNMFYSAYEILSLYPNDYFFRPLLLTIRFQLVDIVDKNEEEKEDIARKLKKLLIWVFRTTTIKQRIQQKNILRKFQNDLIKGINNNKIFLENKSYVDNEIQEEFDEENSADFYKNLENYYPKDKHNRSWGYIFRSYYWKKIEANDDLTNEEKKRLRKNILEYSVEHLAPQNSRKEESGSEKIINSLGNITLVRRVDNSALSNKDWSEKRFDIRDLGKNCLMNYLEERNWTDIENINDLVEERKKYLIKDFEKFRVFEVE